MNRPKSLTPQLALSYLPMMELDEEWKRKRDAGELPDGLRGFCGCMKTTWPEQCPTREEAEYILWLAEQGSMRWLAAQIFGDSNQVFAAYIIEAAKRVVEDSEN